MDYKVILSDIAKRPLDDILFTFMQCWETKWPPPAFLEDAENTVQKLAQVGGS